MSDNRQDEADVEIKQGPLARLVSLIAKSSTTALIAVILTFGVQFTDIITKLLEPTPTETIRYTAIYEPDAKNSTEALARVQENLTRLNTMLADKPEGQALVASALADLTTVQDAFKHAPYIEYQQPKDVGFNLISPAYAQQLAPPAPPVQDREIIWALTGVVVLVLICFVALYMFTKDKVKKAFAEKMINTIIAFIFGLITGSMSKRA